jgi:hypothetical protein
VPRGSSTSQATVSASSSPVDGEGLRANLYRCVEIEPTSAVR